MPRSAVPRPSNCWLLYRSDKIKALKEQGIDLERIPQRDLSVTLAQRWKKESAMVKAFYNEKAQRVKNEHAKMYPEYKYSPSRSDKSQATAETSVRPTRRRVLRSSAGDASYSPRASTSTYDRSSASTASSSSHRAPSLSPIPSAISFQGTLESLAAFKDEGPTLVPCASTKVEPRELSSATLTSLWEEDAPEYIDATFWTPDARAGEGQLSSPPEDMGICMYPADISDDLMYFSSIQ